MVNRIMTLRCLTLLITSLATGLVFAAAPVAVNDNAVGSEDTELTGNVLGNDSDADGDGFEVVSNTVPAEGTLVVAANGNFSYTPAPNTSGTNVANYTIREQSAACSVAAPPPDCFATATLTLNINPTNDAPTVVGSLPPIETAEDSGGGSINLSGVFADVDQTTSGDLLTFAATSSGSAAISGLQVTGSTLSYTLAPNQNGAATVNVVATDTQGASANVSFALNVAAVNDAPTLINPIADRAGAEDGFEVNIDLNSVFEDVDIGTNGDALTFTILNNSNPALFDLAEMNASGGLRLTLARDANGAANIVIQADDGEDQVTDDFTVTVASVNDVPVANADNVSIDEDSGVVIIDVLANDYLGEGPATIEPLVGGGTSDSTVDFVILDPLGNAVTGPNGTVAIVNNQIQYRPKANFHGEDTFSYVIRDSLGGTGGLGDLSEPALVTVTVNAVNDAPVTSERLEFTMFVDTVLQVSAVEGLLENVYDIEAAQLDAGGRALGGNFSAVLTNPPTTGIVNLNSDGSFDFTPPVGFAGSVEFGYQLSDGGAQTVTDLVVRIMVQPALPPPTTAVSGTVQTPFDLVNSPLEQTSGVKPNVLIMLDDSGSMDWNISTASLANDGVIQLENSAIATANPVATTFYYLWDLPDNTFGPASLVGRVLPTEASLAANPATASNEFGVWRARHHLFNRLYYNPTVTYQPWAGFDLANNAYGNADPSAVRLDPRDPTDTFNMLVPVDFAADAVPAWESTGGSVGVNVTGDYIPRYYASNAPLPLTANAPFTEVRIEVGGGILQGDRFPGGSDRTDCANSAACTFAEEIQNFANWFQYSRKREYAAKASVGEVVDSITSLRVGLETINEQVSAEVLDFEGATGQENKNDLLDALYSVNSASGTPLRAALERAGEIYSCNGGGNCPVLPDPAGACQQNFTLLFSDGYWNAAEGVTANTDVDGGGPWDGGRYADNVAGTLADTAMFYYETDLRPSIPNRVPPGQRDLQGASAATFANDELMHQHMKTFAIAFGINGSIEPSTVPVDPATPFAWPDPQTSDAAKVDDLLHAAVNGRGAFLSATSPEELRDAIESVFVEFSDAQSSLSAAAFNSTSLRRNTFLYRGFFDLGDNTGDLTATVVNPDGTLATTPVWSAAAELASKGASNRRIVTYDPTALEGVALLHPDLTPEQQLMLSVDEVNWLRGEQTREQPIGPLRQRDTNRLLGDIVNSSPIFVGASRALNRDQAPYPTNDLYSDFVDSTLSRTSMVYVGANDGMLHGFDALTGEELLAYVPNKLIDDSRRFRNDLDQYIDPLYSHKYFVDLTPRLNDVYMRPVATSSSKDWATVLIGGLGGGGKGFFALDVTAPSTQFNSNANAAASVLWEFTDEDDSYPVQLNGSPLGGAVGAITDPDGLPVKDLGYAMTLPTLAMSNRPDGAGSNDWVAFFGNGQNSTAGIATLFALFVDEGLDGWQSGDFAKVSTGFGVPSTLPAELVGFPNGLGTPAIIDEDLNGTADLAYAGDRLGNLYRFDLRSPNPANWEAVLVFTAVNDDGLRQPILNQPLVIPHPTQPGFLVIFGTGSYFTAADAGNTDIQSIYGIWDDSTSASPVTAQSGARATRLVEQTITNVVDDSVSPAQTRRIVSRTDVVYAGGPAGTYGWFIDLDMQRAAFTAGGSANGDSTGNAPPAAQFPGEKAIRNFILRNGTIVTPTVLPSTGASACFGPRAGSILVFDVISGGDARDPILDFNTDGVVNSSDLVSVGNEAFSAGLLFDVGALDGPLVDLATVAATGDTDFLFVSGGNDTTALRLADVIDSRTGRQSWRELEEN